MGAYLRKMGQLDKKERDEVEERVERSDTTIVKFLMVVTSTAKSMNISTKFQLNF